MANHMPMTIDQPALRTTLPGGFPANVWLEILELCDLWDWVSICGTNRALRNIFYQRTRIIHRLKMFGCRYEEDDQEMKEEIDTKVDNVTEAHELFWYLRQLARISHNLVHQSHVLLELPVLPNSISFETDDLVIRIHGILMNNTYIDGVPYWQGTTTEIRFDTGQGNPAMVHIPLEDQFLNMSLGNSTQAPVPLPDEHQAWAGGVIQAWTDDERGQVLHDGTELRCFLANKSWASCIPLFTLHNNMHFQFASNFCDIQKGLRLVMWDRKYPQALGILDVERKDFFSYSISVTLPQEPGYAWSLESLSYDLHRAVLSQRFLEYESALGEIYVRQRNEVQIVPLLLVASQYVICEVFVR